MTGKIFINYRRGDDAGHTGRLFDRLQDVFPPEQLFLDVDNIAPGLDFVRVLNERVAECDIVLAVIGKGWLDSRDAAGNRRLEDTGDFVRIEITSALNQGKRVIPVLVGDAQMPHPEDLPEALRPLTRRNAVRLTHERFRADTQGLIKAIQQGLSEIDAQRKVEAEAARHAQEEEERGRREAEAERRAEECRHALASDDTAVLNSFIRIYKTGADVRQVRARLRNIEPRRAWQSGQVIAAAGIVALIIGTAVWWIERTSSPVVRPNVTATAVAPTAPAAASMTLPQNSAGSSLATATAAAPATPSVDAITWSLLKETTDDAALKRFVKQYPDSSFRNDAEARIAALVGERTAGAEAAARAQAEAAKLAAATQQSGNPQLESPTHPDAEQSANQSLAGSALIQAIKMELTRVGCYAGKLDDDWTSPAVKQSIVKFVKAASLSRAPDNPSTEFLGAIRNQSSRVCPLECAKTEIEANGRCVAKTCSGGQKLDSDGNCQTIKQRTVSRPSAADAPPKAKVSPPAGTVATGAVGIGCGRFGCKEHPVVNAPAGLPCKHAWQGKRGGWNCTD
jgi:hypothetical protein